MANFAVSLVYSVVDHLTEKFDKWREKGEEFEHNQKKHFEGASEAAKNFGAVLMGNLAAKGVEKLGEMVKETINLLPEFAEKAEGIGRMAQTVGMATDEYQKLHYATHLLDLDSGSLDKALEKLNLGLGKLHQKNGPLMTGLRGVDSQLLLNLRTAKDSSEAFLMVADAVQKSTSPQQRAAIALAAFGKAGQELIPTLMKGREGLQEMMGEADKYGSVLSEGAISNSEKFSESLKKIKGALGGLKDQVLGGLLEKLTPVVEKMSDWIGKNREAISQGIGKAFDVLTHVLDKIGPPLERLGATLLPAIGNALTELAPIFETVLSTTADLVEQLAPILSEVVGIVKSMAPALNLAASIIKAVLVPALGLLKPMIDGFGKAMQVNMMIWSQTIGWILEGILRGIAAVGTALGQNMSSVSAAADAISQMRSSSTTAVFGPGEQHTQGAAYQAPGGLGAPNSASLRAGNVNIRNNINVDNSRAPGTTSRVNVAPGIPQYVTDHLGHN